MTAREPSDNEKLLGALQDSVDRARAERQQQPTTIESQFMRMGDHVVVEPRGGANFEAEVIVCLGWGLVHGVMDWRMRRVDDGEEFTYGISIHAPVQVVAK